MVSLTWDTCQFWGRDAVGDALLRHAETSGFANLRLDDDRSSPQAIDFLGERVLEVF
jgi:hypothetical protein